LIQINRRGRAGGDHMGYAGEARAPVFRSIAIFLLCGIGSALGASVAAPPTPLSAADAAAIAQVLQTGPQQGIPTPDVGADLRAIGGPDPKAASAASADLETIIIAFALAEHGGPGDPRQLDPGLALKPPYDAAAQFLQAQAVGRIADWARDLPRQDGSYLSLAAARQRYAQIADEGGWPLVKAGESVAKGQADPRISLLRQRLAIEGYPSSPSQKPNILDPSLSSALAAFQLRHGLEPNGVLDKETVAALNVSAAARLATIDLNLLRARWLPNPLPPGRIEVDIANPAVVLFVDGKPALSMLAVVGDIRHHTPTFASEVSAVVFNPPWIVPVAIARAELYPKERRNPGYFRRNGFVVRDGRLIQRAGPKAALGYIKFDVPDPFEVYLHDTPARSLFTKSKRWLSHGCVRLQAPRDLAALLLGGQGWSKADVDDAIDAKVTRAFSLKERTPVFVLYRTAVADSSGATTFFPDVYEWDAELASGRRTHAIGQGVGSPGP